MLSCDVMLANISKFREQGTMSNAHAVLQFLVPFVVVRHSVLFLRLLVIGRIHAKYPNDSNIARAHGFN